MLCPFVLMCNVNRTAEPCRDREYKLISFLWKTMRDIFRKNYDQMHYILPVQTQPAFELNFRLTTLVVEKGERTNLCPACWDDRHGEKEGEAMPHKVWHCDKKRPECLSQGKKRRLFWYIIIGFKSHAQLNWEKRDYALLSTSRTTYVLIRRLSRRSYRILID